MTRTRSGIFVTLISLFPRRFSLLHKQINAPPGERRPANSRSSRHLIDLPPLSQAFHNSPGPRFPAPFEGTAAVRPVSTYDSRRKKFITVHSRSYRPFGLR
jgi:hypothetical protein